MSPSSIGGRNSGLPPRPRGNWMTRPARGEIEMVIPYQLHGLRGTDGALTAVEVATLEATRQLPADVLLPFFGLSMDLGPIATWGMQLGCITSPSIRRHARPTCRACSRSAT